MWGKVCCLRKQHNGRDWPSHHQPADLKSNVLTEPLHHWAPHKSEIKIEKILLETEKKNVYFFTKVSLFWKCQATFFLNVIIMYCTFVG